MAAATINLFLGQSVETQYADLKSAGVLVNKGGESYNSKTETYTFLTATFYVELRNGVPQRVYIETTKVPALA